ncbi:MAG: AMP-binding protein [Alphaproteobacteria bacterium]|nr:AMP-binding protein [Alphaproteobacteria bacterium]
MSSPELSRNLVERVAVGDMLRRRARDSADRDAVVDFVGGQRRSLTYRQLNQQVNQLVRGLRHHGLKQGDRLALLAGNSLEFMTVAFACYKAGIIFVPINFCQNSADIRYNLSNARVSAVVFEPAHMDLAMSCSAGLDDIILRVNLGSAADDGSVTLAALLDQQDNAEIEDVIIHDRDTAQLLYTSGTTSHPKGVEASHLSLTLSSLTCSLNVGMGRHHRQLVVLPLFHCGAFMLCLSIFQCAGRIVMIPGFDADRIIELLESERINVLALLPMMWKSLMAVTGVAQRDFTSLETAIYAMAHMDKPSLERLRKIFDCKFHLVSGQTEFFPPASIFYDGQATEFAEGNYWGVPTLLTDQAILDDHGRELPHGMVGEICWRGPHVMNGYYHDPEESAKTRQFGWHHSGDLGLIDDQGQLLFVDRKKDMIKTGGENVSSCKVEQVLITLPGVAVAAVFGVPHPRWSEAVCAAVQPAPGTVLTAAEIIEQCKQHLSGFQVPKTVVIVDTLPMTSTGKVQKAALRQRYKSLFDG